MIPMTNNSEHDAADEASRRELGNVLASLVVVFSATWLQYRTAFGSDEG